MNQARHRARAAVAALLGVAGEGPAVPGAEVEQDPAASTVQPAAGPALATGRFAEATQRLRTSTQWLLAALAAVGAGLVTGLQLTQLSGLGTVDCLRGALALASTVVTLASVAFMIYAVSTVLTDDFVSLAELADEEIDISLADEGASWSRKRRAASRARMLQDVNDALTRSRQETFAHVATGIPQLHRRLHQANEALREATPTRPRTWQLAVADVESCRATVTEVTDLANYFMTAAAVRTMARKLVIAGIVAALGLGTFAWSTAEEESSGSVVVQVQR